MDVTSATKARGDETALLPTRLVGHPRSAKLGCAVAARMVADISEAGWPDGQVLGSEPDLLRRYGVSRAVLREGIRLLEHQEVARMRRGPGGGLVVTVPTVESAVDAVAVYLLYVGAELDEVTEVRLALHERATELAAVEVVVDLLDRVTLRYEPAAVPGRSSLRADNVLSVPDKGAKLAESIARQIFSEVAGAGWVVGSLLGSEPELMERFDVSRAVLREAVRVLEHHQIACMRRGPGGGLFVAEPGIGATTDALAVRLSRAGVVPADLVEVLSIIETTALNRLKDGLDEVAIARLRGLLDGGRAAVGERATGHDVQVVLATLSGNRVLELLTAVLVQLSLHQGEEPCDAADLVPTDVRLSDELSALYGSSP